MTDATKTTYEIRVYRGTALYFNTHTHREPRAVSLLKHFRAVFAEHDGYKVAVHKHTTTSATSVMEGD